MLLAPGFAASVLHLPVFVEQAENYFRLVGLLTGGFRVPPGSASGSIRDGDPMVLESGGVAACFGLLDSGFREFSVDAVYMALGTASCADGWSRRTARSGMNVQVLALRGDGD